jgi:pimeloyl-ACP methyl ester carboxylesterase
VCAGEGRPPVVICPALGATTDEWQEVQRLAARETTVCVYDRTGLGGSDGHLRRPAIKRMAGELHTLLHAACIPSPYILAGHSLGGYVVRVFAALYPNEVAGVALIDSSHPQQRQKLPRTHISQRPIGALLWVARDWAQPLGLRRLARDLGLRKANGIPTARHRRADTAEFLAVQALARQTRETADSLGSLPLAVLTANSEHAHRGYSREWAELQADLAALSDHSQHVMTEQGSHHLNRDNPEVVAQVLIALVQRVRAAAQ